MTDAAMPPDQPDSANAGDDDSDEEPSNAPPDESTLMGRGGVEEEVLAELARAEGEMNDPSAPDGTDDAGAQV
jgi:hypothetical protein